MCRYKSNNVLFTIIDLAIKSERIFSSYNTQCEHLASADGYGSISLKAPSGKWMSMRLGFVGHD